MRGGQLDRHIVIQRMTATQSPSGEEIKSWATLSARPASLAPLSGAERFNSEQLIAKSQVAFNIRWSTEVADVSPLDRIIYPASALTDSPSQPHGNTIYDIIAVEPIGRNEGLKLVAYVRQDESN